MKLQTKLLQEMVTRVSKGAGNNNLIPMTTLINILGTNDNLILTTTDATNYFSVITTIKSDDVFEVSVNAEQFVKLVQKMTCEEITLQVLDTYMMVIGNGKYKIDLLLDENGAPVRFPENATAEVEASGDISTANVRQIIANNKSSLSINNTMPVLMNYYCGDTVITSDNATICRTDLKLFDSVIQLISPTVMELLSTFTDDKIHWELSHGILTFEDANTYLYAPVVPDAGKMPIEAINSLVDRDIPFNCEVGRDELLAILDRLSLFVSQYDKNLIYLTFTDKGITIESKKSNGKELLEYAELNGNPFETFTCAIDILMLKTQVSALTTNRFKLFYGAENAIKLVTDGVNRVVALQEDDR